MDEKLGCLPFEECLGGLKSSVMVYYQANMDEVEEVKYDRDYFDKYVKYKGTEISNLINKGRIEFVNRYTIGPLIDIGIGSGEFIEKSHILCYGYDINPYGVKWLKERGKYIDIMSDSCRYFTGFTFWDSLEHIKNPHYYFNRIDIGKYVFVSIPIFRDINHILGSKHYRPNEHFYYFTYSSFISWMRLYGFEILESSNFEIEAGREDIYSFAFKRVSKC